MSEIKQTWHTSEADYGGKVQFPYLDELRATNVDLHFEAMGDTEFWMSIRCRDTGRTWHLNCGAIRSRARGYAFIEKDSSAPVSAQQDHDGTEGRGEGARAGDALARAWDEGAKSVWESLAYHAFTLGYYLDDNPYREA